MKRLISILLIVSMLPNLIGSPIGTGAVADIADCGQCLVEASNDSAFVPTPPKPQTNIQLTAIAMKRALPIRVSFLRLAAVNPHIKSYSARHSEMRSGDVSSMRI